MKALHFISFLMGLALAFDNTPPIPERTPGFAIATRNRLKINIELFSELLCDGCAMLHPEFEKFLNMNYLGSPVRE